MISPSVFFAVVTTTLAALQALGQVQVMTDGGPTAAPHARLLDLPQRVRERNNNFGLASAQGLVLLIFGMRIAAMQFGVVERRVHYR